MSLNANALIKFENETDFDNISRIIECLNEAHLMWYIENTHMCLKFAEDLTRNLKNPSPNSSYCVYVIYSQKTYIILKGIIQLDYERNTSNLPTDEDISDYDFDHPINIGYCMCMRS